MSNFFSRSYSHIKTVLSHKKLVFNLSVKAGIPFRGIIHDFSKFSPTELFESIKYYTDGKQSPIVTCKRTIGYSKAWQHHTKCNKHHLEYWIDENEFYGAKLIPYKYWVELICDNFAAGINYRKNEWEKEYQLEFWNTANKKWKAETSHHIHPAIESAIGRVFNEVAEKGIDPVINKDHLKNIYDTETKKIF